MGAVTEARSVQHQDASSAVTRKASPGLVTVATWITPRFANGCGGLHNQQRHRRTAALRGGAFDVGFSGGSFLLFFIAYFSKEELRLALAMRFKPNEEATKKRSRRRESGSMRGGSSTSRRRRRAMQTSEYFSVLRSRSWHMNRRTKLAAGHCTRIRLLVKLVLRSEWEAAARLRDELTNGSVQVATIGRR